MEAHELRIGNLVTLNENQRRDLWYDQIHAMNDFFEVKTIYSDGEVALELDDEIVDLDEDHIEPIPLTEEWHLKFGAEVNKTILETYFNYQISKDLKVTLNICNDKGKGEWYVMIIQEDQADTDAVCLKKRMFYVHEWQNLFHSLTGKELTLAATTPQD